MRTVTAGELTTLGKSERVVTFRVKIANGSGTMVDLTRWVESLDWDEDVDQPVAGLTIGFRRDDQTTLSLSPLREDSALNRLNDGVTYSPQLAALRAVTVEAATTQIGASIVSGDWKMVFDGTISPVEFGQSPVSVVCRDKGGLLVDRWVETKHSYGSGPGVALETVIQSELDDVLGGGTVTLHTPVSPAYNISPAFQQQEMSLFDAILDLQQLRGWDTRYRWNGNVSELTLKDPNRGKTTPDYTIGPNAYYAVHKLEIDPTAVRNAIKIDYPTASGYRASLTVTDATSITNFGRQFFRIVEPDTSPVNTSGEATDLVNSALADLKDPKAEQEVEMPFFWPAELGDLYRFKANGVHYSTDQDLAVVGFKHHLSAGKHRTTLILRGKPSGGYLTWLDRAKGSGSNALPPSFPPTAIITPGNGDTTDASWNLVFDAIPGSGGGGTIISYVIYVKESFADESVLASGDGSTLPRNVLALRGIRSDAVIRFVVTDTATGLSDTATYVLPSSRQELTDLGQFKRANPYDDGDYALRGTTSTGDTAHSGVKDSTGIAINRAFKKAASGDPNTLLSVPDDASYSKTITSRVSSGKPLIDFSEGIHIGKNLDNIADGSTYSRTTANEKTGAGRAYSYIDAAGKFSGLKFVGTSGTPGISVPTGAGAMGTSPTGTITGTDSGGFIHTVVGTSPAASGDIATVTFATAYATAPFVVIAGASSGGMNAKAYSINVTTTGFTITTSAGYGGAGAILDFYYIVIG